MVSYDRSDREHVNHSNNNKRCREFGGIYSDDYPYMGGEYKRMKKIICEDCKGYGYFKIDNIHESCQMCNGNGYHLYLEEGEEFGNDCASGKLIYVPAAENAIDWSYATDEQILEIIFTDMECPVELKWQALHEMRRRNGQNKPKSL